MNYTITITRTTIEERPAGKEWTIVSRKPSTQTRGATHDEFGYTPEITKKKTVEQRIYEQTLDKIDITNIIAAVNGAEVVTDIKVTTA